MSDRRPPQPAPFPDETARVWAVRLLAAADDVATVGPALLAAVSGTALAGPTATALSGLAHRLAGDLLLLTASMRRVAVELVQAPAGRP